ncbi:hypothetical protein [Pontibacillus yanchengensis]|uniref:Uncharacterized protein n=1 Tax=Pontibacillus yanchengensis Y32 TaxID=1385514 RepID=A0A0A2TEI7_9BACI|nr:hypothetical protein [Pontibacillus yanchengensis]KGP72818.1 hypothetical protein N782_10105 [Pontibacillus yanchengensis Y32]
MQIIFNIIGAIAGLTFFNWLFGYRKGAIRIDFDERYTNHQDYIEAIQTELESQGREVEYVDYRHFIIDGKSYEWIERNAPMGVVPLQRTILLPMKKEQTA